MVAVVIILMVASVVVVITAMVVLLGDEKENDALILKCLLHQLELGNCNINGKLGSSYVDK